LGDNYCAPWGFREAEGGVPLQGSDFSVVNRARTRGHVILGIKLVELDAASGKLLPNEKVGPDLAGSTAHQLPDLLNKC
jgi:hypothetical protein